MGLRVGPMWGGGGALSWRPMGGPMREPVEVALVGGSMRDP